MYLTFARSSPSNPDNDTICLTHGGSDKLKGVGKCRACHGGKSCSLLTTSESQCALTQRLSSRKACATIGCFCVIASTWVARQQYCGSTSPPCLSMTCFQIETSLGRCTSYSTMTKMHPNKNKSGGTGNIFFINTKEYIPCDMTMQQM